MTPNILICQNEHEVEHLFKDDFIAHFEGSQIETLRSFYSEISELLEIPDFGFSLESLNDALNDLQWLEDKRVVLYFTNTEALIRKERDPVKMGSLINILDATAEDWKWVGDEVSDPKEIVIVFEDSSRIRKLLDDEHIAYVQIKDII